MSSGDDINLLLACNEEIGSSASTSSSPVQHQCCLSPPLEQVFGTAVDRKDEEEALRRLVHKELLHSPASHYCSQLKSQDVVSAARSNAVHWMIKVRNVYGFSPLTVALSVSYFDRYLSAELRHRVWKAWMIELLSVACVSLAAKMEEPYVPLLQDLQIEGLEHLFESVTIQRMEVSVMKLLDWRMNSVTPFSFIGGLLQSLELQYHLKTLLWNRINELLLGSLAEMVLLDFSPSEVAASATICAVEEIVPLQAQALKSDLLKTLPVEEARLDRCYQIMEELVVDPVYPMLSSSQVLDYTKASESETSELVVASCCRAASRGKRRLDQLQAPDDGQVKCIASKKQK